MDQLLALDTLFLGMENDEVQANIGGVSVFEGPAPTRSELADQISGAFEVLPIFRRRVLDRPPGLGRPLWVDDEDFDLDRHLIDVTLGRDVTLEKIHDFYGGVMSQHLDREHPLWKIHVVRGLPNDEWAILWTVHHAMVDGIAATELMGLLLSFDPEGRNPLPQPWNPRAKPEGLAAARHAISSRTGPFKLLRDLPGVLRRPHRLARTAASTTLGLLPAGKAVFDTKDCPLNGPIGPERIWRTTELDLAKIKLAGTVYGCTVNDIVLAAVTSGLREFLHAEGAGLENCRPRTMVPVSIRKEDESGVWTNRVSAVFVNLPVELDDPVERLASVRQQMDDIKSKNGEATAESVGEAVNYLPHAIFNGVERAILSTADVSRFFNTVTTNVPGPQVPLYCLGRKMRMLHPYIMLMKDLRVATAVVSYDGKVGFGVTGDVASETEVANVCKGISVALDELLDASPMALAA